MARRSGWDVIVVGAGVFGTWTAWHLARAGKRVLLLDAFGVAHARASSGGESRMIRASYGADEIYSRMALASLAAWRWLSERAGLPIFHPLGVLFFFSGDPTYLEQTIEVHQRLGLPTERLAPAELSRRYPQLDWAGVVCGLFEPGFGALMARRAVQTLAQALASTGAELRLAAVLPPEAAASLRAVRTSTGESLAADRFVFACGAWLPRLFPAELGGRIFPTRQEVFFIAPPSGDDRYGPAKLPGWAEFDGSDLHYGFPDLEARGFKIAHDRHGPPIDPDLGDRVASEAGLASVRAYLGRRFPALADRPLVETRVCVYENSANGDLLIDRHPALANVWLVGGGSGHGFKHGPEVGRLAAALVLADRVATEPRFALAAKSRVQHRSVH
jgi:monomeric sarcosine oxidase